MEPGETGEEETEAPGPTPPPEHQDILCWHYTDSLLMFYIHCFDKVITLLFFIIMYIINNSNVVMLILWNLCRSFQKT